MDIAYFSPSAPPATREEIIQRKKENFWAWLKKSQEREDDHSINLDKAIPGFASVIAIAIFLLKEFIINKQNEVFTEFHFTLGLQFFNIAILLIILLRSLKIATDIKVEDSAINKNYIFALERQFVKKIKWFFAMTMCLYIGLMCSTSLSKSVIDQDQTPAFEKIRSGRHEIFGGIHMLRDSVLSDSSKRMFDSSATIKAIQEQLGGIHESLKQILYNDSIRWSKNYAVLNCLQSINKANEIVADSILRLEDAISPGGPLKLPKGTENAAAGAINHMYHGTQEIRINAQPFSRENSGILVSHIFTLLASNLGALFLIYAFFVLYKKTIEVDGSNTYNKSLLTLSHIFGGSIQEDRQDPRAICRYLIICLIGVTTAHAILESNFRNDSEDVNTLFAMLSGLCNALALSLLVARFESSLMHPTFHVLVILYTYAIIQVLFGVFNMPLFKYPHLIEDVTILIAFIGKCFLYLYVLWLLRTDRLKYYFYHKYDNISATKEKLSWDEFLEKITPHEVHAPTIVVPEKEPEPEVFISEVNPDLAG